LSFVAKIFQCCGDKKNKKEAKKEVKAFKTYLSEINEDIKGVYENTQKAGNKSAFSELRQMRGLQGYSEVECFRQILNAFRVYSFGTGNRHRHQTIIKP